MEKYRGIRKGVRFMENCPADIHEGVRHMGASLLLFLGNRLLGELLCQLWWRHTNKDCQDLTQ